MAVNKYTQEGEHFSARVVEDVVLDSGEILIPKQSKVKGTIVKIQKHVSLEEQLRFRLNLMR